VCQTDQLEKKFKSKTLCSVLNYITASHNGVTEMELVDLLSCNNEFFSDYYDGFGLPAILRFPTYLWLLIKYQLGMSHLNFDFDISISRFIFILRLFISGDLLSQKYMDNKVTYYWSYDCIKKAMKQRFFNKVELIRVCHKDIANYFLESFVETKPLVDMNKNMQIRFLKFFFIFYTSPTSSSFIVLSLCTEMKKPNGLFVNNHFFTRRSNTTIDVLTNCGIT
jgi:hypothetical protein